MAVGIAVAAVIVALLAERLATTEKRRILSVINDLREAVAQADISGFFTHISPDYRGEGLSRNGLRAVTEAFFDRFGQVRLRRFNVRVNRVGNIAIAEVSAFVSEGMQGRGGLYGQSVWEIEVKKEADGAWRVTNIVPVRIGGKDAGTWSEVMEIGGF